MLEADTDSAGQRQPVPALALPHRMAPPEILWRCTRPDGAEARCVLVPARPVNSVVWFLNDVAQGVRDLEDADEARDWAVSTLWIALQMGHVERCHP